MSPAEFHPLKGPMTTQSLRGMVGAGAMHWCGDRNGGFDAPILHGLCTYGNACRAILKAVAKYDHTKITGFDVRFEPGEPEGAFAALVRGVRALPAAIGRLGLAPAND